MTKTDVLIIGSGIAALSTAYRLARYNIDVTVVTKGGKKDSNSALAQGGAYPLLSHRRTTGTFTTGTPLWQAAI